VQKLVGVEAFVVPRPVVEPDRQRGKILMAAFHGECPECHEMVELWFQRLSRTEEIAVFQDPANFIILVHRDHRPRPIGRGGDGCLGIASHPLALTSEIHMTKTINQAGVFFPL